MRRAALVLSAALAAACGGDSGPSTLPPPPARPAPLIPLAWANVPNRVTVRAGDTRRIRLTLTKAVRARLLAESDHARVSISNALLNGGVLTATLRGLSTGRDTIRLTATAQGYETARVSIAVTVEGRPTPPPPDPIPNDPRFRRTFWRQLAFDAHDCPRSGSCKGGTTVKPAVEARVIAVLSTTSPNFYIRTHDDAGNRTFSSAEIATMRRVIPHAVEALTGTRFRGEILWNRDDGYEYANWIRIAGGTDLGDDVCGRAWVGGSPGDIQIAADYRSLGCSLAPLIAHEVGHAMGFFHVPSESDVMHPTIGSRSSFSNRETYHARLAYRLGRGHPYADGSFTATQAPPRPDDFEVPVVVCRPGDF